MSVNHKITVLYREGKEGTKGNGSKVSSVTGLNKIREKKESNSNIITNALKVSRMIRTLDVGGSLGLFSGGGGAAIAIAGMAVQELNKWHDIYLSYSSAVSGESVYVGNLKKTKQYILSFGGAYLKDAIQNHLITKNVVHRQNVQNQYYRDLYFEKFDGNQYGGKK